jgi:hypothetical protein
MMVELPQPNLTAQQDNYMQQMANWIHATRQLKHSIHHA